MKKSVVFIAGVVLVSGMCVEAKWGIPKLPDVIPGADLVNGVTEDAAPVNLGGRKVEEMSAQELTTAIQAGGDLSQAVDLATAWVATPRGNFLKSSALVAAAVGLKGESDLLKAEADALGSGTVTQDDLEKAEGRTQDALLAVEAKLASSEPMSAAAAEQYRLGAQTMRKAVVQEAGLIGLTAWLSYETAERAQNVDDVMDGVKLASAASGALYLAKQVPGDVNAGWKTYRLVQAYGKSNNIAIEEIDEDEMSKLLASAK